MFNVKGSEEDAKRSARGVAHGVPLLAIATGSA